MKDKDSNEQLFEELQESDGATTKKIETISKLDEKQYAQQQYDLAVQEMLNNPTFENIQKFEAANKKLFEVQDAYRIGAKLMLMRAKWMDDIVKGINNTKSSQRLHLL